MGRIKFTYTSSGGDTGWDFTDCYQNTSYGSSNSLLKLKSASGAVFNDDSRDRDFRVESDSNTHALFVDAGNDRVEMAVPPVWIVTGKQHPKLTLV